MRQRDPSQAPGRPFWPPAFFSWRNTEDGGQQGNGIGTEDRRLRPGGKAGSRETIVLEVFKAFVHRNENRGLILDGYPRTLAQAASLDAILRLSSVVLFEISEEAVLSRVSGRVIDSQGRSYNLNSNPPPEGVQYQRRHDDQPEVVRKRFREHCREIEPIASHYRNQGILLTVDAAGSIGAVLDQLLETLGEVSPGADG